MGKKTTSGIFMLNMSFVILLASRANNADCIRRKLELIPQPYLCYVDDVLLISPTEEEHERALFYLVYYFARFHLTINMSKCELGKDSTAFLGHWLSEGKMHRSHKYVDVIKRMPLPKTVRDLRTWMGIVNFVRNYLPKLAHYQGPLNKTGSKVPKNKSKKTPIEWTPNWSIT